MYSHTVSTSDDICICSFIIIGAGATSGAGTPDYVYVCRFVYFLLCIGSIIDCCLTLTQQFFSYIMTKAS